MYKISLSIQRQKLFVVGVILLSVFWMTELCAKPAQVLRVAVLYIEEPPYIYPSPNSGYQGIFPSLAQALSRELNLELVYIPTGRKGLEQLIIDGKADFTWLSPDWVKNKEQLIFSESVFLTREFFYSLLPFSKSDEPIDWLRNKSICLRQDYLYPSLNQILGKEEAQTTRTVRVSSQVSLIKILLKERCDLLYTNEYRASWMKNSLGIERNIWRSPKPLDQAKVAFMFNKKWGSKMSEINQALSNIKRTGELDDIIETHVNKREYFE